MQGSSKVHGLERVVQVREAVVTAEQSIVQTAHCEAEELDYAIKFFMWRAGFEQKKRLYFGSSLGSSSPRWRTLSILHCLSGTANLVFLT